MSTTSVTKAVEYATKRGARVLSMSLAAERQNLSETTRDELENAWFRVLDNVVGQSPAILVAAAGSSPVVRPDGPRTGYDLDSPGPNPTLPWTPEERLHLLHQLAWEAHPDWQGTYELKDREVPIPLAVMARLTPAPTVRTCTWLAGRHPRDDLNEDEQDRFFEIDWTMDSATGALTYQSTPVSWR